LIQAAPLAALAMVEQGLASVAIIATTGTATPRNGEHHGWQLSNKPARFGASEPIGIAHLR
jgi:hypothetical protein